MDNQGTESSGNEALSINDATQAFSSLFEGNDEQSAKDLEEKKDDPEAPQDPEEDNPEADEPEKEEPAEPEADSNEVTIEVDGKTVKLTKEELAEAYKNGLRQSDYTKKTMEVAEQRKAAEAQLNQALQERQAYQQNLQKMAAQLEGVLGAQQNIDWEQLLESDPTEYLKQQHLFQQRQAAYQKNIQEQQYLEKVNQQEYARHMQTVLSTEQQALLDSLPEWKNEAKANEEKAAIRDYMLAQGFDKASLDNLMDHRAVILSRKAMLYDKTMAKASAAAKKVAEVPQKVLKPGSGEKPDTSSNKQNMERLKKSGSVMDAANVFKGLI